MRRRPSSKCRRPQEEAPTDAELQRLCDRLFLRRFWWCEWIVKPLQRRTASFSEAFLDRLQIRYALWQIQVGERLLNRLPPLAEP